MYAGSETVWGAVLKKTGSTDATFWYFWDVFLLLTSTNNNPLSVINSLSSKCSREQHFIQFKVWYFLIVNLFGHFSSYHNFSNIVKWTRIEPQTFLAFILKRDNIVYIFKVICEVDLNIITLLDGIFPCWKYLWDVMTLLFLFIAHGARELVLCLFMFE